MDYLVKPVEIWRPERSRKKSHSQTKTTPYPNPQIGLLVEQLLTKKNNNTRIAIPTTEGLQFVRTEDIIYLEASANYTNIYCTGSKNFLSAAPWKILKTYYHLVYFCGYITPYIINKSFAEKYIRGEGGQVVLSNGVVLDVAKRKKTEFLKPSGIKKNNNQQVTSNKNQATSNQKQATRIKHQKSNYTSL